MTSIEQLTLGAYEIEGWRQDGALLAPPVVEGRFLLVNGTITTILRNRSMKGTDLTTVLLGTYTLSDTHFEYEYSDTSVIREGEVSATVSHVPLWIGGRVFEISETDKRVVFSSKSARQEFLFTSRGISYSEDGVELRRWRRSSS
jgi:hypothetical protein